MSVSHCDAKLMLCSRVWMNKAEMKSRGRRQRVDDEFSIDFCNHVLCQKINLQHGLGEKIVSFK